MKDEVSDVKSEEQKIKNKLGISIFDYKNLKDKDSNRRSKKMKEKTANYKSHFGKKK